MVKSQSGSETLPKTGIRLRNIYDGLDPEGTFRTFEKSVRLWCFETDIPRRKQGAKLLRALSGMAQFGRDDL